MVVPPSQAGIQAKLLTLWEQTQDRSQMQDMGPRSKRFKVWYLLTHQGSLEPVSMPRQDARLWMLISLSGPWWSLVSHYHLGKTWASTWANLRSSAIPGSWEVQSSTAIYPAELNEKSCSLCFNLDTVSAPQWIEVPIQRSEKSVTEFPFFLKNFRPKRSSMVHFLSLLPPPPTYLVPQWCW